MDCQCSSEEKYTFTHRCKFGCIKLDHIKQWVAREADNRQLILDAGYLLMTVVQRTHFDPSFVDSQIRKMEQKYRVELTDLAAIAADYHHWYGRKVKKENEY